MRIFFLPLPSRRARRLVLAFCFVFILGVLVFYSSLGVRQLLPATGTDGDPLFQVTTDKKIAALTINVAWGEEYLPAMLEALKEADVHVTFFMVGDWVRQFPDLTRALSAGGHELGNHSWSHPYPTQIAPETLKEEIQNTEKLVRELTGQECKLFAPPYGEWDKEVVLAAAEIGYRTIMWTIDTIDWQKPGVDVIISRVADNLAPGSIVLMHPTDQTAKALPQILARAKEKGFQLMTVGHLMRTAAN